MHKAQAEKRLAKARFEIDWTVTGKEPEGPWWSGTIDPIDRLSIGGDCFGPVIWGDNAADWYKNAVAEAESLSDSLCECDNPDCDYHDAFTTET